MGPVGGGALRGEPARRARRQKGGARIADLLHALDIPYQHEAKACGFRPDFYVPQWRLVIEYWGVDAPGSRRRRRKVAACKRAGLDLINLENDDWWRLEDVLLRKLYRWDRDVDRRWREARRARHDTGASRSGAA